MLTGNAIVGPPCEKFELIFIDEQEMGQANKKYTAVTGAIMDARNLNEFRDLYYPRAYEFAKRRFGIPDNTFDIGKIPHIHGSDLLRDYPDDKKIDLVRLLLKSFKMSGGKIVRVGYFDRSLEDFRLTTKVDRLNFVLSNFLMCFGNSYGCQFAFVHELDVRSLEGGLRGVDEAFPIFHAQDGIHSTIDVENFVGHFFAKKSALGCQVADISGYISDKRQNAKTDFHKALGALYDEFGDLFMLDQIVWMKHA